MNEFESGASPEVQAKAEKLGWIPPARFKGDAERFIDADEYLERGETVLPIVKEHNRRLEAELAEVRKEASTNAAALRAAQTAIEQIEERHTVATQKAVENARAQVKAQLAAASEAGDYEGVAELTDQLTQLKTAQDEAKRVEPLKPAPLPQAAFVPPPDMVAWNEENPWFGKDKRKTALALGIAQELREGGESATGRRFFDLVVDEMNQTLASPAQTSSKVEGARHGSGAPKGGGKGFDALPPDAQVACDADARKFVGAGKRFKTAAEWRSRYAELYFEA